MALRYRCETLRIHLDVVLRVNCLLVDSNRVTVNLGQGGRESRGAEPSGLSEEVDEEVTAMAAGT